MVAFHFYLFDAHFVTNIFLLLRTVLRFGKDGEVSCWFGVIILVYSYFRRLMMLIHRTFCEYIC